MFRRSVLLALFVLGVLAPGPRSRAATSDESLSVDVRYRALRSRDNVLDPAVVYGRPVTSWLGIDLGARVGVSSAALETFDYKVELVSPLASWASVGARLYQSNHLALGSGITQLFAHADVAIPVASFLDVLASLGWFERYTALSRTFVLPGLSHTSFSDHDIAFAFGFRARPARDWLASFQVATFETFDVFNLNGPFFALGAEHRLGGADLTLFAQARYRVLLGFGRASETALAVGARWDFAAAPTSR